MTVAAVTDYPRTDGGELARWVGIAQAASAVAERIADTDFVPAAMRGNAAVVTAAIMYGDELGIGPMQALAGINVIKGKPSPSSELMRALVFRDGHSMRVIKSTGELCRIAGQRRDEREPTIIEWSLTMARAAGLLDANPTWRKYPRAMLLARATSELCRVVFPDVVKGLSHLADDDTVAADLDAWASTDTGTDPEPAPRTTTRVARKAPEPMPAATDALVTAEQPVPGLDQPPLPFEPPDSDDGRTAAVASHRPTAVPDGSGGYPTSDGGNPTSPNAADAAPSDPSPALPDVDDSDPRVPTDKMLGIIHMLFSKLGVEKDERAKRLAITATIIGRQVTTSRELTRREGLSVIRLLNDADIGAVTFDIDPDAPYGITIHHREDTQP